MFGLRWLLARLNIYPNAYYNYKKHRKKEYFETKNKNKEIIRKLYHEYEGNPGHRMIKVFLNRKNIYLSKNTVLKYMKELGIKSVVLRKKPKYYKGECYKKFDNLLKQDFKVDKPNKKWCTDFTYLYLADGTKRYNCSILDLYDKSIVATLNSNKIDAKLAIETLKVALSRNKINQELILHSDQGTQYTSRAFTEYCKEKGITQSMSKAGCPYDNSCMESFYGTFKGEFIWKHQFENDEILNSKTNDYVYGYYNHIRPHSSNDNLTPFEKRHQ